ncbi:serine/threonine-protein kinase [Paraliomyxa miuraensis]|uniref:serine/threonine-protein kinase n=1 Tax=Paraliomyxa miuraensis TaxID=376150 RepID=UPI00225C404E|nr:serine/threonine-protein kinase [Paraliomyxa miuraensis]MCX4247789.1 serine/threonine-protein kinase [Paraliomyxa miuraensis]
MDASDVGDDPAFALVLQRTQHAVQQQVHGVELAEAGTRVFLGRYRVERLAGRGGMGTVLTAEDTWLERKVALKIVNTPGVRQRRRLVREGRALAKLSHPNVVQVHDVELGERGEHAYVVMEYVEGTTLAGWQESKRCTTEELLDKYRQAAHGLLAAHQAGIVHRDFKPHNVLVDAAGVVKVADFGLAGASEPENDGGDAPRPIERAITAPQTQAATATEASLGLTPGYCPPEQLRGKRPTERADQFAFCVALYEALTGVLPFGSSRVVGEHERAVAEGIRSRPEAGRIPWRVLRVLERGLAVRPEDRFADMTAIIAALEPRGPRWPWITMGLVPVAAVLTAMLMPDSKVVEVDPCTYEDDELPLERWPEGGGDRGGPRAFIDERAAAYRLAWKDAREGLCRTERRGKLETTERIQAQTCLNTTAREFNLVMKLLAANDSPTDPFMAFDNLRAPKLCVLGGGRPAYGAADPLLRGEFDEVRALQLEGRNEEALPRARALHERARQLGDVVILAQVSFLVGKIEGLMYDGDSAAHDLEEASIHAETLGDDVLALDAYAELTDVAANLALDPSEGVRWELLGGAKLGRILGVHDSEVAGQYYSAVANLAYRRGDLEAALEHGERAHGLLAATVGEDGLATLVARANRAATLVAAKRAKEAIAEYEQILEIRRRRYGERHPATIADELALAHARMVAGERAQALEGLERVKALSTPATTKPLEQLEALAVARQCEILVGNSDHEAAAPTCERAFGMLPRLAGNDRGLLAMRAIVYGKQALVLVAREELEPALALLDQERELLLAVHPENAAMLAVNSSVRCMVLDALDRTSECAQSLVQGRRWYEASGRLRELTRVCEALGLDPQDLEGATER